MYEYGAYGMCDISLCNSVEENFINCNETRCAIGNCKSSTMDAFEIPNNVPIKQLIKGSMASPFVRLRFQRCVEGFDTPCTDADYNEKEITTGNLSQPCNADLCRAVIKSFQFGWGSVNSGNICKIVIHDEKGSSFTDWFRRMGRNPQSMTNPGIHGVFKMMVQFGWIVVGGGEVGCPAVIDETAVNCASKLTACTMDLADQESYSDSPDRIICSPPIWFIPNGVVVNDQNGKFVYEIEGVDTNMIAVRQPIKRVYGGSGAATNNEVNTRPPNNRRVHFVDAVVKLGLDSVPPFRVEFHQLKNDNSGDTERLQFWVQPNTAVVGTTNYTAIPATSHSHIVNESPTNVFCTINDCLPSLKGPNGECEQSDLTTEQDFATRGPIGVWDTRGLNPLAAIQNWLLAGNVLATDSSCTGAVRGRGITMYHDPIYPQPGVNASPGCDQPRRGRLILAAAPTSACQDTNINYEGRLKACYIVRGGNCTPVLSFSPNIKNNFNQGMRAGGIIGPENPKSVPGRDNLTGSGVAVFGAGFRNENVVANNAVNAGQGAGVVAAASAQTFRANFPYNAIEAELKVQGDPSIWLCSPFFGAGRTIAILVINPYYLNNDGDENQIPSWKTLTDTACNDILSNKNWRIVSVEHNIKDGQFTTSIKVTLDVPGVSIAGGRNEALSMVGPLFASGPEEPVQLGGDSSMHHTFFCEQGTWSCKDLIESNEDLADGTNPLCDSICTDTPYEVT